jgi:hypothetical protein
MQQQQQQQGVAAAAAAVMQCWLVQLSRVGNILGMQPVAPECSWDVSQV